MLVKSTSAASAVKSGCMACTGKADGDRADGHLDLLGGGLSEAIQSVEKYSGTCLEELRHRGLMRFFSENRTGGWRCA